MLELGLWIYCSFVSLAVEQILEQFCDRFMKEIDAKAIMYELKRKDIIGAAEVTTISQNNNPDQNNGLLYDRLLNTCDDESFTKVCDMIIAVRGNPKMKNLGKEMKSMLASEFMCTCDLVCLCCQLVVNVIA